MARAVGLVGHALEELRAPLAVEVWHRVEAEASADLRGAKPATAVRPRRPGQGVTVLAAAASAGASPGSRAIDLRANLSAAR